MRSHRFYADIPLKQNTTIELPIEAAHHCAQVLRYKVADQLTVFNGDGYDYLATIAAIEKKRCSIQILSKTLPDNESPLNIHLIQGVARGEKMDLIIQKAVELGVSEFTPLFTERCNVKLDPKRLLKKQQHWQKIVISACEQSGRATLPKLNDAIAIDQLSLPSKASNLILDPDGSQPLTKFKIEKSVNVLIGPEGGFSQRDIAIANQLDCHKVTLGPRILRTETAGLAAIVVLQSISGDF